VKDYTQLTDRGRSRRLRPLARRALRQYDIEAVGLRGLPDATNGVFRVDTADGGRFLLRIGLGPPLGHSEEEMRSELEFVDHLSSTSKLAVPEVVRTPAGDVVVAVEGEGVPHRRLACMFTWLDGPLLMDRIDRTGLGPYGAAMATLHLESVSFTPSAGFAVPTYDRAYPYRTSFTLFTDAGDDLLPPPRRVLFEEAHRRTEQAIAALAEREPPRLIHGDLHGWNAKQYRGRVSVFDFEDLVWGWPVQDIGVALYYLWPSDAFDRRWREFREGYESVAPWPDRGGEVATFVAGRTLVIANDVIRQPEWMGEAPGVYERGERRIRAMLDRIEHGS
jgi:Ser/Thr protein kinase RdoA (MazF antagonist)